MSTYWLKSSDEMRYGRGDRSNAGHRPRFGWTADTFVWKRPVDPVYPCPVRLPEDSVRSSTATVCVITVLAAWLLAGCAEPHGLRVIGPAISPSIPAGPVYMADDEGRPVKRPDSFALNESTMVSGLHWTDWGGPTAEATGDLRGTWCMPQCTEKPYRVKVTLSGVQRQEAHAYYSRAGVVAPELRGAKAAELGRVSLHTPEF